MIDSITKFYEEQLSYNKNRFLNFKRNESHKDSLPTKRAVFLDYHFF